MRAFLLLFLFISTLFSIERVILEPQEAFKFSFNEKKEALNFKLNLGKDIYLYDDKLKVYITKPTKIDITNQLDIPKPQAYEQWIVQFNDLSIDIPYSVLKQTADLETYDIEVAFQGCSKAGLCYAPMKEIYSLSLDKKSSQVATVDDKTVNDKLDNTLKDNENLNETDLIANTLKDSNFLAVLFTFFGFGLLLSFTPCIFPMIPILSSIIVRASNEKELTSMQGFFLSFVYVFFMALAYTIAGVVAGLFGANLQVALQNPYVLSVFAAIFVALAFSMFGYYKLELPQGIQNRINKTTEGKEKQGIFGIAIMGFLSALIVGPCVAPPLAGALVYIGQTGDAVLGGAALFVMSIGMGVPLLLIGLGAGKFMPKPGGWMDSISKIFGIVMLAVAVWMLDRVLEPIYVMCLWALLLIGTALYLEIYKHILVRLLTKVIMVYGIVLFVGALTNATNPLNPLENFTSAKGVSVSKEELSFKYVKNLDELENAIKNSSKPVMLDFYAKWCVSCKELENITFKDDKVISKLKEFTLLKADVTKNTLSDKAMQDKFNIVGPPALIFWDENNQEIKAARIVGYKNAEDFLEVVNRYFK